jgi:ABC-type multidrug transport system fused ATPase/permease subunit
VIKAMAGGGSAKASTRGINENYRSVAINSELNSTKIYVIVQALPVVLLGALIYVSYNIMELQVSVILVFLLFMMRIAPRIGQLQQHIQTYYQSSDAVRVVTDAIGGCHTAVEDVNSGAKTFDHIENTIELDAVEFRYPNSASTAVNNVSMTIHRNQLVAIVGSSGSGKSTIIDLLAGLRVPDKGEIKIDGIRLGQLDLISWRRKLGVVTQDATVFNASLRNNLTFSIPKQRLTTYSLPFH